MSRDNARRTVLRLRRTRRTARFPPETVAWGNSPAAIRAFSASAICRYVPHAGDLSATASPSATVCAEGVRGAGYRPHSVAACSAGGTRARTSHSRDAVSAEMRPTRTGGP